MSSFLFQAKKSGDGPKDQQISPDDESLDPKVSSVSTELEIKEEPSTLSEIEKPKQSLSIKPLSSLMAPAPASVKARQRKQQLGPETERSESPPTISCIPRKASNPGT